MYAKSLVAFKPCYFVVAVLEVIAHISRIANQIVLCIFQVMTYKIMQISSWEVAFVSYYMIMVVCIAMNIDFLCTSHREVSKPL